MEWFSELSGVMQMFWGIAIIASVVFVIQAVLTFVGIDSTDAGDVDFDFDDSGTMDVGGMASLFSIRSMINFFVGFGWAGVSLRNVIENDTILVIVALVIGFFFAYWYVFFRKKLMKLESNGAYKISDCLGKEADVYLRIPAGGRGKVQISLGGSIHEIDAMSDSDVDIASGERVKIIGVEGNILKVKK